MTELRDSCSDVRANLALYVGGDLDLPVLAAVGEHLRDCAPCRAEAERARGGRGPLLAQRESARFGAPADFDLWPEVRIRLVAEGLLTPGDAPVAGARQPLLVHPRWRRASGLVAAGLLGLLAIGSWLTRPREDAAEPAGVAPASIAREGGASVRPGSEAPVAVTPVAHGEAAGPAVADRTGTAGAPAAGGLRLLRAGEVPLSRLPGSDVLLLGADESSGTLPGIPLAPDPNRAASVGTRIR